MYTGMSLSYLYTIRHGTCPFCQMDLSILLANQSSAPNTNRNGSERRASRSYNDSSETYEAFRKYMHPLYRFDAIYHGRLASMGIIPSRLDPFRGTDISNGVYADSSDSLGRVWYHIPNLGPKFCDAVRKYSIVANYREAHVIARKRSKDSECMWIGIVGDPASYTTGSKRHIIDLMLRNPGQSFDQSTRRQQGRNRSNRSSLSGKRRKRRRRRFQLSQETRSIEDITTVETSLIMGDDDKKDDAGSCDDSDQDSSQASSTPSVFSLELPEPTSYRFSLRENSTSPPQPITLQTQGQFLVSRARIHLPSPSNFISQTRASNRGWNFSPLMDDPAIYAFREPPIPSPEPGKHFELHKAFVSSAAISGTGYQRPLSPLVVGPGSQRRYSVSDLNELLMMSDSNH